MSREIGVNDLEWVSATQVTRRILFALLLTWTNCINENASGVKSCIDGNVSELGDVDALHVEIKLQWGLTL